MPTLDELRFDARARAEGLAQARQLESGHLEDVVRTHRTESAQATSLMRAQWETDWRHYESEVQFSDKEAWQAKVWIPMPWSAVEQATAIIQKALLDSPEFFGIEGYDDKDKMLAQILWKPLLKAATQKAGMIPKFADATKYAFAIGQGYLKFRYPRSAVPTLAGVVADPTTGQPMPQYTVKNRGFLAIDIVAPWNIYRDWRSTSRAQFSGRYLIHEAPIDRADLLQRTEAKLFDPEVVASLPPSGTTQGPSSSSSGMRSSLEADARRAGMSVAVADYRVPYWGSEWWGDVPDRNGDIIATDCLMLMVNDRLVMGPVDNPIWAVDVSTRRRKWPFIGLSPLSHPGRFEGQGIVRSVAPLASLFSNLFNLFMDGMNWEVNPPSEIDLSILDDWDDLQHVPGKLWLKRGQGHAFEPANMGRQNTPAILATLQFVDQMFQNNSFVNAFLVGLPGSRSYVTKGEVQMKTAQSMGIFDAMARNLEYAGAEGVALCHDLLWQYMNEWTEPSIQQLVGPQAALLLHLMPYAHRLRETRGDFNYSFSGISSAIHKADLLGRLLQIAQVSQGGGFAGYTNPQQILGALIDVLGLRDKIDIAEVPSMPLPQVKQLVDRFQQRLAQAQQKPKVNVSLKGDLDPFTALDLADDGSIDGSPVRRTTPGGGLGGPIAGAFGAPLEQPSQAELAPEGAQAGAMVE